MVVDADIKLVWVWGRLECVRGRVMMGIEGRGVCFFWVWWFCVVIVRSRLGL